jgi:RNA polymerase sigma-70 factor (ECF subfamily)
MFTDRMLESLRFHKCGRKNLKKYQFIDVVNAPELSDEELYASFVQKRDRAVMASLYRKYMALVFGVCMKYLHEKHAAQDATMEIFERLLQYEPKEPIRRFKPFLYVLSKNHCLMKKRGEKPQTIEISDRDMEIAEEVHPIDEKEVKLTELERCLKELKDLQHACVEQFYLKQKSYLQISKELKVTLNAVKSHIQNGKRNIKACMEAAA